MPRVIFVSMKNPSAIVERESGLSRAQLERLYFVEFRLLFLGSLRRSDLMREFGTAAAAATRDIALYREKAPYNLELDQTGKVYVLGSGFRPLFNHSSERVLTALSRGFGAGVDTDDSPLLRCDVLMPLTPLSVEVIAPVTRAIHLQQPLRVTYFSMSSGKTEREIVPLGLAFNGVRWHVRAFDRRSNEFRDFVLARMDDPKAAKVRTVEKHETSEFDVQWTRIVEIELIPHPNHARPDVVRREYGMVDGNLRFRLRASNAGYLLRLWNVDCSPDHSLKGAEYTLWLKDPLALYGIETAKIAPGYRPPSEAK